MRLPRRGLIRSIILAIGLDPAYVLGPFDRWAQDVFLGLGGEADAAPSGARLSSSQLDDLIAFAELLVEGRALSPVERASLVENIAERVAREPDYLALCRTTVSLLQRLAGRRFSSLDRDRARRADDPPSLEFHRRAAGGISAHSPTTCARSGPGRCAI